MAKQTVMKLNLKIDVPVHTELKRLCEARGQAFSTVISHILNESLAPIRFMADSAEKVAKGQKVDVRDFLNALGAEISKGAKKISK